MPQITEIEKTATKKVELPSPFDIERILRRYSLLRTSTSCSFSYYLICFNSWKEKRPIPRRMTYHLHHRNPYFMLHQLSFHLSFPGRVKTAAKKVELPAQSPPATQLVKESRQDRSQGTISNRIECPQNQK